MWIATEASKSLESVHNLFKIVMLAAQNDAHFAERVSFGINHRPADMPKFLAADENWQGGLPLLVPVDVAVKLLPDFFVVDDESGYVYYSDAWPTARQQIEDMLTTAADSEEVPAEAAQPPPMPTPGTSSQLPAQGTQRSSATIQSNKKLFEAAAVAAAGTPSPAAGPPTTRRRQDTSFYAGAVDWSQLRDDIRRSQVGYMRAWAPFAAQADAVLEGMAEVPAAEDLYQPTDEIDAGPLLALAAEARGALIKRLAADCGEDLRDDGSGKCCCVVPPAKAAPRIGAAAGGGPPVGVSLIVPRIKSLSRFEEKAVSKYEAAHGTNCFRRVRDLCRMACVCESLADLCRTVRYFGEQFEVVQVDNRFAHPTSMGWRDVQLILRLPLAEAPPQRSEGPQPRSFLIEVQVQLRPLTVIRGELHRVYGRVRTQLAGWLSIFGTAQGGGSEKDAGRVQLSADVIMGRLVRALDELEAPPKLAQPVPRHGGMLKLYFRSYSGVSLTIGLEIEFAVAPPLPAHVLPGLGTTARDYYNKCMAKARVQPKQDPLAPFETLLFERLPEALFDEHGALSPASGAYFQAQAGPPPRCSSRALDPALAPCMPQYLKTSMPLATPARLCAFAGAPDLGALHERVREAIKENFPDSEAAATRRFWGDMEWDKVRESDGTRGVVFVLQGVREAHLHHIWSCADKGAKMDGRFFKEANVLGLEWTLGQLVREPSECLGLVATLISMGGN